MPTKTSEEQDQPAEPPHYVGHRERLRDRFHAAGPDALSDYELLEMVLFTARAQGDVKPLAKTLIKIFGSFGEVINAPEARLRQVKGVGDRTVTELKLIAAAASRIAKGQLKQRTMLSSWNDVIDYCRTSMVSSHNKLFTLFAIKQWEFKNERNRWFRNVFASAGLLRHRTNFERQKLFAAFARTSLF